jgi:hypothetical protein
MQNKIAGLYVQLARTLNALETAGETLWVDQCEGPPMIEGLSGNVERDPASERWTVVQP